MSLAVDASSPIRWAGAVGVSTNVPSASFTPPAGSLAVLTIESDTAGTASLDNVDWTPVTSGLTWTNRVERDPPESSRGGHASIWTAPIPSSVAMTVDVSRTTGGAVNLRVSCKLYVVTGQHASPIGNVVEGDSATNNLTTSAITTTVGSLAFFAGNDWNTNGTPGSSDLTPDAANYSGQVSVISGYKTAGTTSTTANLDAGGAGAAAWNYVGLEILAAAGGGETFPAGHSRQFQSPLLRM